MSKRYTCAEIAEKLNVKISTVRNWIRNGELAAWSFGRAYMVDDEQLNAFAQSRVTTLNTERYKNRKNA